MSAHRSQYSTSGVRRVSFSFTALKAPKNDATSAGMKVASSDWLPEPSLAVSFLPLLLFALSSSMRGRLPLEDEAVGDLQALLPPPLAALAFSVA
jgi:hypothetical protein